MIPKSKIKITDDIKLRNEIFELLSTTDQKKSSRWALTSAIHILNEVQKNNETIKNSIKILSLWQQDQKTTAEVRQAAFAIHKLARESQNEAETSSLRALGHAIASGHTKANAIIASDYAIQFSTRLKTTTHKKSPKKEPGNILNYKNSVNLMRIDTVFVIFSTLESPNLHENR